MSKWPADYWAEVRVLDLKTHTERLAWVAFMLPHELVQSLARFGRLDVLRQKDNLDPLSLNHIQKIESEVRRPMVALGIWGDGVPCNWDRAASLDCVSMNMPGLGGKWRNLRLPVTCLNHKQVTYNTWIDIMAVITWSLSWAGMGFHPSARHDDKPFGSSDAKRRKAAGSPMLSSAALVEVRGDWKFMGEVFGFPKHNTAAGLCWNCRCTPADVTISIAATSSLGGAADCYESSQFLLIAMRVS